MKENDFLAMVAEGSRTAAAGSRLPVDRKTVSLALMSDCDSREQTIAVPVVLSRRRPFVASS